MTANVEYQRIDTCTRTIFLYNIVLLYTDMTFQSYTDIMHMAITNSDVKEWIHVLLLYTDDFSELDKVHMAIANYHYTPRHVVKVIHIVVIHT